MMILITYDINTETPAGQKRLRKVAKACQNYGQRVQNSVFECLLDPAQLTQLRHRLTELIDVEKDSLRFYNLGDKWAGRVDHVGAKASIDLTGPLVA
jgi:CRISPR-associated protein Cas2